MNRIANKVQQMDYYLFYLPLNFRPLNCCSIQLAKPSQWTLDIVVYTLPLLQLDTV